jgi:2-(1,2-epoxy-1,2-dihydrophenyl)acetyl-CoA isomerase
MQYSWIETDFSGGIARIFLNRPDLLNSFTIPMALELQQALTRADEDEQIRAVWLSGKGRAFCAGQDLQEAIDPQGPDIEHIVATTYNPIIRLLRGLKKPVICAVNGVAAGAGANIAFACDLTLASENASFIQAFSKIGLIPDSGGTFVLPRWIGMQRAAGLMMLGDKLSATQAKELGLIWQVVPAERLLEETEALAQRLAHMPTRALALTKQALNQTWENTLEEQLALEGKLQAMAAKTQDHQEGVNAFLEKRPASFTGK